MRHEETEVSLGQAQMQLGQLLLDSVTLRRHKGRILLCFPPSGENFSQELIVLLRQMEARQPVPVRTAAGSTSCRIVSVSCTGGTPMGPYPTPFSVPTDGEQYTISILPDPSGDLFFAEAADVQRLPAQTGTPRPLRLIPSRFGQSPSSQGED